MQIIGSSTSCKSRPLHDSTNRTQYSSGRKQAKKNYGAKRCRNAFLSTTFSPIATQCIEREWEGKIYNYITQDNYRFLRDSYNRYAELLGIKAEHQPGKSVGDSMSKLYTDMVKLVGNKIGVNIEYKEDKLYFTLWKYHSWGDHELYWIPVKFLEILNDKLRDITTTFLYYIMRGNDMEVINQNDNIDFILEWIEDSLTECDKEERKTMVELLDSYRKGKAYELLKEVSHGAYTKDFPTILKSYKPCNDFEQQLVNFMIEGLNLMDSGRSIMEYSYDPYSEEEPDFFPLSLDQQIMIVYDCCDIVTEQFVEYINSTARETYEIIPATAYELTPQTDQLFTMDDYPERFFKWLDKFITLVV